MDICKYAEGQAIVARRIRLMNGFAGICPNALQSRDRGAREASESGGRPSGRFLQLAVCATMLFTGHG